MRRCSLETQSLISISAGRAEATHFHVYTARVKIERAKPIAGVCTHKIGACVCVYRKKKERKRGKTQKRRRKVQTTDWIDTVALDTTSKQHFIVLLRIRSVNNNKEKRKSGELTEKKGKGGRGRRGWRRRRKKQLASIVCTYIVTSKLMYGCRCSWLNPTAQCLLLLLRW